MKTSEAGIEFIKKHEGLVLHPYDDGAGFMTVGWGHKLNPSGPRADITLEQAEQLLASDMAIAEDGVNRAIGDTALSQQQFDALADFCFNLGAPALRLMIAHGIDDVPRQIPRWDHAAGKVMPGLVTRRQDEVELWNS